GVHALDEGLRIEVAGPWNDRLDRTIEVLLSAGADGADVAASKMGRYLVQDRDCLLAAGPFGLRSQQILLGDHLPDRTHILRHTPVHQHEALLEPFPRALLYLIYGKNPVIRQQAPAADSALGIAFARCDAMNQFDPRPHSSRILPSAAAAAQPLAENGARGHQPPVGFLQSSSDRRN